MDYDFSGWATRNDLLCSDGRTIRKNAFIDNDGQTVPLVWNHDHNSADNVLGHALLENREEGVYAYCTFNDTESGQAAKKLVQHGDVKSLSIYANKLKQKGGDVIHGAIRELSLVLAGANPGAYIDFVMAHGEDGEEEFEACYDENIMIYHADYGLKKEEQKKEEKEKEMAEEPKKPEEKQSEEKTEKTAKKDVFNELTEEQKNVVYAIVGAAIEDARADEEGGDEEMKHNLFDGEEKIEEGVLCHADEEVFKANYSFGKFANYVINETINQGYNRIRDFINELRDYLRMCKQDDIKPTLYSSYLKQTHDITSRNHNVKVEKENEEMFQSRYKDFKPYRGKKYIVVAPKNSNDLKKEGDTLNHCVASYIKRVIDGECLIYFLRIDKDESLITFEVRHNDIVQVRGLHNRKPSTSEVQALKDFAKYRKLGCNF